ncbi:MAG: DUF6150 family protein [Bacteroidota bacterium]
MSNMKWISILWVFSFLFPVAEKPVKTEQFDPCKVFGAIYIEEFPENAQFLVFEEESEAFAKMLIFEEDNKLMADKSGKWYFTDKKAFARYSIYFVDRKSAADFSIYFTNFESFAGCRN